MKWNKFTLLLFGTAVCSNQTQRRYSFKRSDKLRVGMTWQQRHLTSQCIEGNRE
jgi:hypothetical protein